MSEDMSNPDIKNESDNKTTTKKKKRTLGRFPCPDCDKEFSRSDHLARHHLNHKPKEVFECDYYIYEFGTKRKCGKTFVRKDLRERHVKRHLDLEGAEGSTKRQNLQGLLPPFPQNMEMIYSPQIVDESPATTDNQTMALQFNSDTKNYKLPTMNKSTENLSGNTFPRNTGYTQGEFYGTDMGNSPHKQMTEIYNKQFNTFNPYIPQTQNDILSWLFNQTLPESKNSQNTDIKENVMTNTSQPVFPSMVMPENNYEFNNHVSSPYDVPITPFTNQQMPFQNTQIFTQTPNMSNNTYSAFQNENIFLNEDNPLEELFTNNQFSGRNLTSETEMSTNSSLPLASNISTNSPTSTNESNKSPDEALSNITRHSGKPLEQAIFSYSKVYNVVNQKHLFVDSLLLESLFKVLPSVSKYEASNIFKMEQFNFTLEDLFSYYLSLYWALFHPQFSILHKPSFDTKRVEPLLLFAMILVGSNYTESLQREELLVRKKSPEFKFSILIAEPLRYLIFQHEGFKSPVQLWVLQSLNLLEFCEKNFLLRRMHERAHIHHGTTVQLLRRSPLLGGNPAANNMQNNSNSNTSAGEEDSDASNNELSLEASKDTTDLDLFNQWVNSESLKRVTFMTFYLDIMDYIKFRHDPHILFYQMQFLNLPCDDDNLWDSYEINGSFKKIVKRQKKILKKNLMKPKEGHACIRYNDKFLGAIRKLLKHDPSSLMLTVKSSYTKKLLFAGLVSVMYQIQQQDLQSSTLFASSSVLQSSIQKSLVWKEILSKCIDNWSIEIHQNIQSVRYAMMSPNVKENIKYQCHFSAYHLTQIIGMCDINHYDIAIFGGSPANRSVNATMKDIFIVQKKLNNMWQRKHLSVKNINDLVNLKSIIHCYLLLWETLLVNENDSKTQANQFLEWDMTYDYYDCALAIGISTLVLWSYTYSTCGLESRRYDDFEKDNAPIEYKYLQDYSAEGAYLYLHRIKLDFQTHLRKYNLHNDYGIHPFKWNTKFTPNQILTKYCELLPLIANKQNISGLCFFVATKLLNSQWEVLREQAKLILNCGLRSIGKTEALCMNLFDNEFSD